MIRLQLPLSKSLTLSWEIGWDHDPEPIKIQEVIPFFYLYYLYISNLVVKTYYFKNESECFTGASTHEKTDESRRPLSREILLFSSVWKHR